jgi:hypothetical protein
MDMMMMLLMMMMPAAGGPGLSELWPLFLIPTGRVGSWVSLVFSNMKVLDQCFYTEKPASQNSKRLLRNQLSKFEVTRARERESEERAREREREEGGGEEELWRWMRLPCYRGQPL